jgi:hypothetical protein
MSNVRNSRAMVGGCNCNNRPMMGGNDSDLSTDAFVNKIIKQHAGNNRGRTAEMSTDAFIDDLLTGMSGGKKRGSSIAVGQRFLNTVPSYVSSDSSDMFSPTGGGEKIRSKSDEIHEETIKAIIKIMKLDTSKPDDLDLARSYKHILYHLAKKQNPNASGLDRAIAMKALATDEKLKSIKKNELEEARKTREKMRNQGPPNSNFPSKKP